jgi:hypothetical protein
MLDEAHNHCTPTIYAAIQQEELGCGHHATGEGSAEHTSAISTAEFGQFISNTTFNGESAHFFASATSVPPLTSSRGNYQATKVSTVCNRAASGLAKSGADPSAK